MPNDPKMLNALRRIRRGNQFTSWAVFLGLFIGWMVVTNVFNWQYHDPINGLVFAAWCWFWGYYLSK